jgi:fructose-1,6-bisphosphatase/inositol monophosphatase family enzyme
MNAEAEEFAIDLARRAGQLMRTNFTLGAKKIWKDDHTPVTATDLAINEMVVDAIQSKYPDHAVVGEEQSHGDPATAEWAWVCDPVDGTVPFAHGYPTFAFSIGLAHQGKSVLGVVYDPHLDRLVSAREGHGAWMNGKRVSVGDFHSFARAVVGLEVPSLYLTGANLRTAVYEAGGHPVSLWSFVYEGLLCAIGEYAGVVYGHKWPWDGCALDVVIREAGGVVSDLLGEPNDYRSTIEGFVAAATPDLHRQLLELVATEHPWTPLARGQ